jgi:hypothetical protein
VRKHGRDEGTTVAQTGKVGIGAGFVRRIVGWAAIAAALLLGASARAAAQADSSWRFAVVPYFWASDLTGRVGIGPITTRVDLSFRDIVKILKFGAMSYAEARYRSYVFGIDALYSNVGNGATVAIRGDTGGFALGTKETILNPMAGYQFHRGAWAIEPLLGLRYWNMTSTLDVDRPNGTSHERSGTVSWVDVTPGARVDWVPYRRVRVLAGGDVGGGGARSTWQLYGTVGWDAVSWWTLSAGYRSLSVDYDRNILLLDTNMKGPIVTFAFRF